MNLKESVYPYKTEYPEQLSSYIDQIKDAIKQKKHHDHRRNLFINFLRLAYETDPQEFEIEEKVKVANVRGNIDALYKYIIFEFKSNIITEKAAAATELIKYFSSRENPNEYIGVLTDGIKFEIYQLEKNQLKYITDFELDKNQVLSSYRAIDDLIFAARKLKPTATDITTRFGPSSAVFNKTRESLEKLYEQVKDIASVDIKFAEWNSLLGRVYGEKIGNADLFLRHTYLTVFSRLLIADALFPDYKKAKYYYKGVITGDFFVKNNLPNVAEPDFFTWAYDTKIEDDFIALIARLDKYLSSFTFNDVNEDILKEIYQELVDPESRHSLGEYYTPDWIADIALERIDYKGEKILDPACGSGTFLLAAIRRLRKLGFSERELIVKASDSVAGIDVHPLAVIMTKANILLALAKEIKNNNQEIYLPVYMADTLMTIGDRDNGTIRISVSIDEEFRIPIETTEKITNWDILVDQLCEASKRAAGDEQTVKGAWLGFYKNNMHELSDKESFFWKQNFYLMNKLIRENRDTIWSFILKNAYRPAFISQHKVDYIVGNPPWLAYRYIKDNDYKQKIKELVLKYELLDKGDIKLFTQMDTSTLFFVYSIRHFLKPGGQIAFVLPKTTILPSKQHFNFQKVGFNEIHDFSDVTPLFNVRSALLVKKDNKNTKKIPKYTYKGKLPGKNLGYEQALNYLEVKEDKHIFIKSMPQPSYYYNLFKQGATIVPRCFWFIQKDKEAAAHKDNPYIETDDTVLKESKENWRKTLTGRTEKRFIYRTVLAKDIVPFGISGYNTIMLPIIKQKNSFYLVDSNLLLEKGFFHASAWLHKAENLWKKYRQTADRNLIEWLNYNDKLTNQTINAPYVVLFNTSGTNIASALYEVGKIKDRSFKTYGFVADAKSYYYYPSDRDEALYLVTILNSSIVNLAIKKFQTQGLYGERDIHRRPFEVCSIPKFDPRNTNHAQLAKLGSICIERVDELLISHLEGNIGRIRTEIRKILKNKLLQIDELTKTILIDAGQNAALIDNIRKEVTNGDLFK